MPSVELTTKPNEQVEGDILFYKRHAIWHMVDRCDRWHAAEEIPTKEFASIRRAIENCWIKIYGAPKYLVVDGEGAIAHAGGEPTAEAAEFLKHHGITPRIRAPDQHARMIERRGAILRHSMHTTEEQLVREGIRVELSALLAECVFSGNSLLSYNGVTPYNARFGRQPRLLPDLHAPVSYTHLTLPTKRIV